jgi:pyruvate dehydrogenase E1 component beta subunit
MPEIAWREALNQALSEEMERDVNVFLMGEEVGALQRCVQGEPGAARQVRQRPGGGRADQRAGFAGLGVGAAMVGLRPVIEMMTWNFAILAMDQIVNNAAKLRHMAGGQLRCPIVFRGPNGAGGRLSSQHSQSLEANYAHFPGLKIFAPRRRRTPRVSSRRRSATTTRASSSRSELLYGVKGEVPTGEHVLPIGKADLKREGKDATLITWSRMYYFAEQAAQMLEKEDIHVDLLDLRTLKPLDEEAILASVRKTNRVVVSRKAGASAGWARRSRTSSRSRPSTTSTPRSSGSPGWT